MESSQVSAVIAELVSGFRISLLADKLESSGWENVTEFWVTPVYEDVASFAEDVSDYSEQWHKLVLGKPVLDVTDETVLADIATKLPLPGDKSIKEIKLIVQFTGIVLGLASGQLLLANACFKSFAHDVLLELVSQAIREVITNTPKSASELDPNAGQAELPKFSSSPDPPVEGDAEKIRYSGPQPGKQQVAGPKIS